MSLIDHNRRRSNQRTCCAAACRILCVCTAFYSVLLQPVYAADYYVSTSGADSAVGSREAPWRTIQRAANRLRPGDTVLVRSGNYPEHVTINVSGKPNRLIAFKAAAGEKPTLNPGSFFVNGKSHIRIEGFHVSNTSGIRAAIEVNGNGRFVELVGNEISKMSATAAAIRVGGTMHDFVIQRNHVHHNDTGNQEAIRVHERTRNFTVSHNEVNDNTNIGIDIVGWAQYGKRNIVFLGEGVFWNDAIDYDKWDLENAEERAAENELPPLDRPQQLAEALGLTIPQLRQLTYHRDAATSINYRRFTIPKRDGTERAIWAPLPRLKEAQRWILLNVVERLLIHGAAHGFLAGRSILSNASVHTDARIIVKMDIKDFFPTVTYPRVRGIFRNAGYREQIATLLALLCTEAPRELVEDNGKTMFVSLGPRCLPQGAPTSPGLTNVICLKMDRRLTGLAEKLGWRYTRYADDMTFSLPSKSKAEPNIGTLIGLVKTIVGDEGFAVHPAKTSVARKGGRQSVTGLIVNGEGSPRVPRKTRRQIRAAIHNMKQGKPLKDDESAATLQGYIAYIAMTDRALAEKLTTSLSG